MLLALQKPLPPHPSGAKVSKSPVRKRGAFFMFLVVKIDIYCKLCQQIFRQ